MSQTHDDLLIASMGDFQIPASKGHAMLGCAIVLLGLSWIAVSLRVYVRGFMIKAFGWDDWLMLVTLAFFTIDCSFLIIISATTVDNEITKLQELQRLTNYVIQEEAYYLCTSIFLKLSLAFFFLRVVVERWQRLVIATSVSIYTLYTSGFLFVAVFQCGNPSLFLLHQLEHKCMGWSVLGPLNYVSGALNVATDWIFAILPIFVLHKVKMPRQAKISVCFLFALGAMGSVASAVRLGYIDGLEFGVTSFFIKAVDIAIASIIERLGIIACSLATLRPLLRVVMERTRLSRLPPKHSSESNSDEQSGHRSYETRAVVPNEKLGSDLAFYGLHGKAETSGTATLITSTDNSFVKTSEASVNESDNADFFEDGTSTHTPMARPLQKYARRPSHTCTRKASQLSSRSQSSREAWEDLEAANQEWRDRTWDNEGVLRIEPSLLLPEADED